MQSAPVFGSFGRSLLLAGTVLTLAGASFDSEAVSAFTYVVRYVAAALLLVVTWSQGREHWSPLSSAPRTAKALILSSWAMVLLALLSTQWSVDPGKTAAQAGTFGLLVATMHVHVTRRWRLPGTAAADFRTIFYTLGATVALSLSTGALVGSRLSGLYSNPNSLGVIAAMVVALGVGVLADKRSRSAWILTGIASVTLLLSENRSGLVGLGVALVWLLARHWRWPNPATAVAVSWSGAFAIAVVLLRIPLPLPTVVGRFRSEESRLTGGLLTGRDDGWELAIDLWSLRPVQGYGFRAGEVVFQRSRSLTDFVADGAHNSYLQVGLELGWAGIIVLALSVLPLLRRAFASDVVGIGQGLLAMVLVGLAAGVVESFMFGVGQIMCWLFWLGAAALVAQEEPSSEPLAAAPNTVMEATGHWNPAPQSASRWFGRTNRDFSRFD